MTNTPNANQTTTRDVGMSMENTKKTQPTEDATTSMETSKNLKTAKDGTTSRISASMAQGTQLETTSKVGTMTQTTEEDPSTTVVQSKIKQGMHYMNKMTVMDILFGPLTLKHFTLMMRHIINWVTLQIKSRTSVVKR